MALDLPGLLVPTDWLADNLDNPNLRVLDATVHLHPSPGGDVTMESGRADYDKGHISGAVFADLIQDLSDDVSPLRFTLPTPERFAAAISKLGIGDDTTVVVYSGGSMSWAPRLWLMLRTFGFDRVAVLDGGWRKWSAEGREFSTIAGSYAPATFTPSFREGIFVDQAAVAAARVDSGRVVVNALSPAQHAGTGGSHYGRPGRISGSVNVPASAMVDRESFAFLPTDAIAAAFDAAGATADKGLVIYCGGGIAASQVAFAQALIGRPQAAVYDASLQEWARDPSAPMEAEI
ncbi:MAG: sulfurtransferase [Alphaproteobacteria bacterium]